MKQKYNRILPVIAAIAAVIGILLIVFIKRPKKKKV